jgi:Spy/CpxP family protein refolding chaperone
MRPIRSLTLAALLLAALPFLAAPALAGPHHGGPGRLERQLEKLGLSDAQKTKVQAILDAAKPKREEVRGKMRAAFDEMRALLDQESPSESAVLAQADKIGAIQTEAHKAMLTTLLAVRKELTPEQRAQLSEAMRKHRHGRWHGRHRGGEKGESPESAPAPESPR